MVVKEYRHGNAIITVYRPDISETDRKLREKKLLIALEQFGKEAKETERWQQ